MSEQKGMTLIEVLVALLVLSVIAVASVTVLTLTIRETEKARVRSIATSIATQRMEELTVMRFRGPSEVGEYLLPDETRRDEPVDAVAVAVLEFANRVHGGGAA